VLTLHTLGECRIAVAPGAAGPAHDLAPDTDRLFSLALLLAGERGRLVPRGQVAEWLWPGLGAPGGRRRLRQALYRLRASGVPVAAAADHLCLARDAVATTFAARPGGAALRSGWRDGSLRLGRCLPGWAPAGEEFRAWVDDYRARTEGAARAALADALRSARAGGDGPPADVVARALVELDPEHPEARRLADEGPDGRRAAGDAEFGVWLGVLDTRLAAARAGAGGLVVLAGPPGGATSELLGEVARRSAAARVLWIDAAGDGAAAVLPLALARALLACPGARGAPPAAVAALRAALHAADAPGATAAASCAPPLASVWTPRLTACLGALGAAVAAGGPLVVCVDNAERAGAAALSVLAGAAGAWTAVPALAVVACAGAWSPATGGGRAPSPVPGAGAESVGRRWGARLVEVAAAVADGRPLLVPVGAATPVTPLANSGDR